MVNLTSKIHILRSDLPCEVVFRPKNFNIRGQHELELAATWAEPENQTELVTGPDRDKIKNFKFFFQKTKSASMPDHHTRGQPAASMYV